MTEVICYNLAEAAALLKCSKPTLRKWVAQGKIPAVKLSERKTIFSPEQLKGVITRSANG